MKIIARILKLRVCGQPDVTEQNAADFLAFPEAERRPPLPGPSGGASV